MTIYEVPWIPRYITATVPRAVIATAVTGAGNGWLWIRARSLAERPRGAPGFARRGGRA